MGDMIDGNGAALSKYMRLCDAAVKAAPSAKELEEARDELLDQRMTGPKLWESLQEWLNLDDGREYDQRLQQVAKHLQQLLYGAPIDPAVDMDWKQRDSAKTSIARCEAREWLTPIVNASISEDEVVRRAEFIQADREDGV
jgi:hypothetical protein